MGCRNKFGMTNMLYIVGTPIGNLEDLSYRQGKILASSDIILTEDTRTTVFLLKKIESLFGLNKKKTQKLVSYYKEKEFERLPSVLKYIEDGLQISLISQAGMPVISDPGYLLVSTVIKEGLPFTVVPGPSAVTTALTHSGFKAENSMFVGFLPKRRAELIKLLYKIRQIKTLFPDAVFIAFESPNRIQKSLQMISDILPDIEVVVARELTKKFEEAVRGKPSELEKRKYKGEITLLLS